ncbi:MAG TPA: hypothetical protein DCY13_12640 [Verrucomicrobiales bacterium]|nr:hypothetical protein [Verrucomicrobiales bacterium]
MWSQIMKHLVAAPFLLLAGLVPAAPVRPAVEVEEEVYTYANANNGAGPMWCSGSTTLVRVGDELFATGLETVADAQPLNNCRWVLFRRGTAGWERVHVDDGRTREPSPLAVFQDGRVFVSANPTLGTEPEPNGGPARPDVLQFAAGDPLKKPLALVPVWQGSPPFAEHSYRSFAADGGAGELMLFQNIGYTHAEWTFRDRDGSWSAQGRLTWPWGGEYDKPGPIRICYPNVALRDRAVHFFGVSDILEPYQEWRDFKRELTGRQWDYDFRRLFYTWTPDITREAFGGWVEIASRDKTGGWLSPGDLWLAPDGNVHLLWSERAIDERLRPKFFPEARQSHALNYAVVRRGGIVRRRTLVESTEDRPGLVGSAGRFHVTPDHRLFVVCHVAGADADGERVAENRIMEILPDGSTGAAARLPLKRPFTSYFTATVRGGSPPSWTLEMLGQQSGAANTISYARVRLQTEP